MRGESVGFFQSEACSLADRLGCLLTLGVVTVGLG